MLNDKVFWASFLISLAVHGVILLQNQNLKFFSPHNNKQDLEIHYIRPAPEKKSAAQNAQPIKRDFLVNLPAKISSEKSAPPPFIDRENLFNNSKISPGQSPSITKPDFIRPDAVAIKKKISLPSLDLGKIDNPSYLSYYQVVREKIKRAAYQNYNRTDTGEAYISFIISSDGYLRDVRLIPERSCTNQFLREIALRSVKDASPFPRFPKDLDYPRLSFNVVISFEIE